MGAGGTVTSVWWGAPVAGAASWVPDFGRTVGVRTGVMAVVTGFATVATAFVTGSTMGARAVVTGLTMGATAVVTGLTTVVTTGATAVVTGLTTVVTTGATAVATGLTTVVTTGATAVVTGLTTVVTTGATAVVTGLTTVVTTGATGRGDRLDDRRQGCRRLLSRRCDGLSRRRQCLVNGGGDRRSNGRCSRPRSLALPPRLLSWSTARWLALPRRALRSCGVA